MVNYIESFKTYLEGRNASKNTISAYISDLSLFNNYCKTQLTTEVVTLDLIDTDLIRAYLIMLMTKKKTNRTISRNVSTLKMFYKYLVLFDYVASNPMKRIKTPKYLRKLPHFFSVSEIEALCNLPDINTFNGVRDKTILELFYSSGLRITELITLKHKNIDYRAKLIRVIGKGRKKRTIPVTNVALEWMQKFQSIRSSDIEETFFLSIDGKPMSRFKVYMIVKKYINLLMLNKGYSPHTIRHTFATHLLNNGANLFSIKEMLGHESIVTTETYTHVLPKKIRDEYLRGHPRANKQLDL